MLARRLLGAAAAALCLMLTAPTADARDARRAADAAVMVDDRYPHLRTPEAFATARAWPVSGGLAEKAARYLGGNPTGWARRWCGRFLRMIVPRDPGPAFDRARAWARYGAPAGPSPGAIGVMRHHVGIVLGRCADGRIHLRSGNHNRRVGDGCYAARRFIAWRA